jgi:hypothetical protein
MTLDLDGKRKEKERQIKGIVDHAIEKKADGESLSQQKEKA